MRRSRPETTVLVGGGVAARVSSDGSRSADCAGLGDGTRSSSGVTAVASRVSSGGGGAADCVGVADDAGYSSGDEEGETGCVGVGDGSSLSGPRAMAEACAAMYSQVTRRAISNRRYSPLSTTCGAGWKS